MIHIASCSFGADSMAQLILAHKYGEPVDIVLYCEVMFDLKNDISGELPEHRDFIYNVAIPKIKREFGYRVEIVRSRKDYLDEFNAVICRGERKGKIRGFPIQGRCCINRDCKMPPIREFYKTLSDEYSTYVGIAADEPERLARLKGNDISLLAKYGITQAAAREIDEKYGLLSPIYQFTKRNGCWFCPSQRLCETEHIYEQHRELLARLEELQAKPNKASEKFDKDNTLTEIINKIKKGIEIKKMQMSIFDILTEVNSK